MVALEELSHPSEGDWGSVEWLQHLLSYKMRSSTGGMLRKLEKAVAASGVFAGVLEESSRRISGNLREKISPHHQML